MDVFSTVKATDTAIKVADRDRITSAVLVTKGRIDMSTKTGISVLECNESHKVSTDES